MNWKLKFLTLIILALPAFTGYPVASYEAEILPGITFGWVIYFLVVNFFILIITGKQFFPNVVTIACKPRPRQSTSPPKWNSPSASTRPSSK